jgi:hypothetical protein
VRPLRVRLQRQRQMPHSFVYNTHPFVRRYFAFPQGYATGYTPAGHASKVPIRAVGGGIGSCSLVPGAAGPAPAGGVAVAVTPSNAAPAATAATAAARAAVPPFTAARCNIAGSAGSPVNSAVASLSSVLVRHKL